MKRAYRQKAKRLHPDTNQNHATAKADFQQLQVSYELLVENFSEKNRFLPEAQPEDVERSTFSRLTGFLVFIRPVLGNGFLFIALLMAGAIIYDLFLDGQSELNRFLFSKGPLICRQFLRSELEFEFPDMPRIIPPGRDGRAQSIVLLPAIVVKNSRTSFVAYFDTAFVNEFTLFKDSIEKKRFDPSTPFEICGYLAPISIVPKQIVPHLNSKTAPVFRGERMTTNHRLIAQQYDSGYIPSLKSVLLVFMIGLYLRFGPLFKPVRNDRSGKVPMKT